MKFQLTALALSILSTTTTTKADDGPPEINTQHRFFADELTQELYSPTADQNDFTSTFGISLAFGLVYPAAIDESYDQMQMVLRFPDVMSSDGGVGPLVWNETSTALNSSYNGVCTDENPNTGDCFNQNPELLLAYRVFADDETPLNPEYEALVQDYVEPIDLQSDEAGDTINEWVNKTTKGKIPSIVPEGSQGELDAVILSSLYLKAAWRDPFLEQYTNQDVFYANADRVTAVNEQAQFMHQVLYNQAYSDTAVAGHQILQLPFSGSSLSVVFALPTSTSSGSLVSSEDVLAALPNLDRRRVALAIPKFVVEAKYEDSLKESLKTLGLEEPFNQGSTSLCIFDNGCQAYIDKIIHKTFIDLNENGVEAAAVTALGIVATSMPPPEIPALVQLDHPFQFFIYDQAQDLVLFEGRIVNPTVAENAPTPQLKQSHNDANFWEDLFYVTPDAPEQDDADRPNTLVGTESSNGLEVTGEVETTDEETAATEGPTEEGTDGGGETVAPSLVESNGELNDADTTESDTTTTSVEKTPTDDPDKTPNLQATSAATTASAVGFVKAVVALAAAWLVSMLA